MTATNTFLTAGTSNSISNNIGITFISGVWQHSSLIPHHRNKLLKNSKIFILHLHFMALESPIFFGMGQVD